MADCFLGVSWRLSSAGPPHQSGGDKQTPTRPHAWEKGKHRKPTIGPGHQGACLAGRNVLCSHDTYLPRCLLSHHADCIVLYSVPQASRLPRATEYAVTGLRRRAGTGNNGQIDAERVQMNGMSGLGMVKRASALISSRVLLRGSTALGVSRILRTHRL